MILSDALILLQTQQVMTSQIRSHIEYLIDLLYSCANFLVEIDEKNIHVAIMSLFLIRFNDDSDQEHM